MLKKSCFLMALFLVAGCDPDKPTLSDVSSRLTQKVDVSVAEKALGPEAYFVDPFTRSGISTPGIYAVRESGRYVKLCENDFNTQTALLDMKRDVQTERVPEIIEDSLSAFKIKVKVLGKPYELPYKKLRVSGYDVLRAPSGGSETAEQYILDNVYENCPGVLERNKPYFIVTEVAVGSKIESISGGGVAELKFDLPLGVPGLDTEVEVQLLDHSPRTTANKVFAMLGKFVK
ncbi:hypothetical protein ACVNHC_08235 [Pannonibacter sp. Q-1]|uniref:hypothetical protein n=1 Tax=Pannonibacter indicus TaxID=466044 RepID=UPI0035B1631F